MAVPIQLLGQAGVRLETPIGAIYIDPYLTDRVAELHGPTLRRLQPAPFPPDEVADAAWVLITHAHLDHCDPATLVPLSQSSPECRFLAPQEVRTLLLDWGIEAERIVVAREAWHELSQEVRIHPVPAAHTRLERHADGSSRYVGYVLELRGRRFYHAGDTAPDENVVEAVRVLRPLEVVFLPVNERNYYRDRAGIVGNMSIREAFRFAEELGVQTVVPIHWDLFAPNAVYPEEFELLYRLSRPPFALLTRPTSV